MRNDSDRPLWTPPRVRLVILTVILLCVLNVFDAMATLVAVRLGATELNPFMAGALAVGPLAFLAAKGLLIVALASFLAAVSCLRDRTTRERKFAWLALRGLTAVYAAVFVWHVLMVEGVIPPILLS